MALENNIFVFEDLEHNPTERQTIYKNVILLVRIGNHVPGLKFPKVSIDHDQGVLNLYNANGDCVGVLKLVLSVVDANTDYENYKLAKTLAQFNGGA